jgi:hypothetical protein
MLAASIAAKAEEAGTTVSVENISAVPQARISTDPTRTFIYVKTPVRWVFDSAEKEAAVSKINQMVQARLKKLQQVNVTDPDGDLDAIKSSLETLRKQVDELVSTASMLNAQVQKEGLLNNINPSALLIFTGIEMSANFAKLLYAGGSAMIGVALVPMEVETYRADTREKVGPTTKELDVAFIGIPTGNVGIGLNAAAVSGLPRAGIGFVWGPLNSAAEVQGVGIGPSVTGQALGAGINAKVMALKNSKPGIANYILMVGVEKGTGATTNSLVDLEAHFGVSLIFDPGPFFNSVAKFMPSSSDVKTEKVNSKSN